jgi:hypothetical protein
VRTPSLPGYRSEVEQAARLGITVRTLRRWRRRGKAPPHLQIGRTVVHSEEGEADWLARQERVQNRSTERSPSRRREAPRRAVEAPATTNNPVLPT